MSELGTSEVGIPPIPAPYIQMIRKTLSVKNGASREAILKFIMENFDVGSSQARANGYLNKALTRAVASGDQKQVLQSDRSAPILPNLRSKESELGKAYLKNS
uniref:H15 domain-containing protein n=1 Tax=Globodera pallida TaxID=36090 RepID=A0A183BJF9_GLOPA